MKILFCGDAAVSTGFALCTHVVCDALHARGHEVHVLGMNYIGEPHNYPYTIYPCYNPRKGGTDPIGASRLPHLIQDLKPDLIILLNDPWNIPAYLTELMYYQRALADARAKGQTDATFTVPPIIGWLAVDGENQVGRNLSPLHHIVVWTEFAKEQIQKSGYVGPISVIPLGVDGDIFTQGSMEISRRKVTPPDTNINADTFLIGVVGRNQHRKRLDLTLEAFARFLEMPGVTNAHLYLHIAPTNESGFDIPSIARYYGLGSTPSKITICIPPTEQGVSQEHLVHLYSALDVYLTTSQGEGWGLPALEAMSCGVPVVAPDWSGLGSWARDAALLVPVSHKLVTAPMGTPHYTIGAVPSAQAVAEALYTLYSDREARVRYTQAGKSRAADLTWDRCAQAFIALVEQFGGRAQLRG